MRNNRLFIEWCSLFAATMLLVVGAWQQQWTHRIDAAWLDFSTRFIPSLASDDIVVVAIDDRSLAEIGNWPWDRAKHAALIDELATHDPALIAVDILFLEPVSEAGDTRLARAIDRAGNVVLPHTFGPAPGTTGDLDPLYPYPPFAQAAAAIGHAAVFPDPDGVVRRFALEYEASGQSYSHLTKVAYLQSGGRAENLTGEIVPMMPSGSFRTISAADIVAQRVSGDFVKGKRVLIGATAQGLGDRYAVSAYGGRIKPGVEMQANLLNAMIERRLINEASALLVGSILILTILILFLSFWRVAPNRTLRISLALIVGLMLLSLVAVVVAGQWIPVFPAVIGVLLAYPVWGWRRLSAVSRFLEKEAAALTGLVTLPSKDPAMGFDTVARQISAVRGLIGETQERLLFLRHTFASSPDAILVFDSKSKLVLLNKRAETLFGTEESNIGQTLLQLISAKDGELDANREELELPGARTFLIASSPVNMLEGHEIISLRDVSDLRENERQRRETLEFLSHDMRSPQAAIVGLAGSAGQGLTHEERLGRIEKQARRTLKLADDFVQIARLEHDGVDPQDCDLCAQLHEAIDRGYAAAIRKSVSIEASIPEEPEFCLIEPSSMARAIDNLLDNAIKFSPDGGTVQVSLERLSNAQLKIEVKDFGSGLPKERRENTFARFGSRQSNGTLSAGLGLAYVKQVVDKHGGQISAQSTDGKGTSFAIILNAPSSV